MADLAKITNVFHTSEDHIDLDLFVKFHSFTTTINSATCNPEYLMYFRYNPTPKWKNRYIEIFQQENHVASFYTEQGNGQKRRFQFANGLCEILHPKNIDHTVDTIRFVNRPVNKGGGFEIDIDIYIHKAFLCKVYTVDKKLPMFLLQMTNAISDKKASCVSLTPVDAIYEQATPFSVEAGFKREPFAHQDRNISWAVQFEKKISAKGYALKLLTSYPECRAHYVEQIDDTIYYNMKTGNILEEDSVPTRKIRPMGACLADEVGLGKTFSMIGLIEMTKHKKYPGFINTSLIIVPRRLAKQWEAEINMSCDLRCKIVSSITQYKQLLMERVENYDVVIMSYSFLRNKSYAKFLYMNQDHPTYINKQLGRTRILTKKKVVKIKKKPGYVIPAPKILEQYKHKKVRNGFISRVKPKFCDKLTTTAIQPHPFNHLFIAKETTKISNNDKWLHYHEGDLIVINKYNPTPHIPDPETGNRHALCIGRVWKSYGDFCYKCNKTLWTKTGEEVKEHNVIRKRKLRKLKSGEYIEAHSPQPNSTINYGAHMFGSIPYIPAPPPKKPKVVKYVLKKPAVKLNTLSYHDIPWKRVILDEGHEILSSRLYGPSHVTYITRSNIYKLESKFRWLCSGTPFPKNSKNTDFLHVIDYLLGNKWVGHSPQSRAHPLLQISKKYKSIKSHEDKIAKLLFRQNTKVSVDHLLHIPPPTIDTEIIPMTQIERIIYDSALGNKQKCIELCNHILVSDHHEHILGGNKPISLVEIHSKMTTHYRKKVERLTKRIENAHLKLQKLSEQQGEEAIQHALEFIHEEIEYDDEELSLKMKKLEESLIENKAQLEINQTKLTIFESLPARIDETEECPVCCDEFEKVSMAITPCSHIFCVSCLNRLFTMNKGKCGMCRTSIKRDACHLVANGHEDAIEDMSGINRWGSKTARLIEYLQCILTDPSSRVIVFSQFQNMLKLIKKVLFEISISNLMLNGNMGVVSSKIRKFKLDPSIRVVLLSAENSASGLNLTEATHIILMDSLDCDSPELAHMVEEQAIGRAVRIGQKHSVEIKRFIMGGTLEHEYYDNYVAMFGE